MKAFFFVTTLVCLISIYSCDTEKNTSSPVLKDIILDTLNRNGAWFRISADANGGLPIREAGVCWDTLSDPSITSSNFNRVDIYKYDGAKYTWQCYIGCLSPETQYYARAYAINAVDTAYGTKEISFKTGAFVPDSVLEAEVIGINQDCGLPAIRFFEDICEANTLAGTYSNSAVFIARNLPEELQTDGMIIIVKVRKIKDSELGLCTHMGPSYPWLYVLEAREKE